MNRIIITLLYIFAVVNFTQANNSKHQHKQHETCQQTEICNHEYNTDSMEHNHTDDCCTHEQETEKHAHDDTRGTHEHESDNHSQDCINDEHITDDHEHGEHSNETKKHEHTSECNSHEHNTAPHTNEAKDHTHENETETCGHNHTGQDNKQEHSHEMENNSHQSEIENLETYILKPTTFVNTLHTTGIIKVSPRSESILIAKSSGIINFMSNQLVEGIKITKGENLFSISGKNLLDGNLDIKFINAKNAYFQSKQNYKRAQLLIKDKIISVKEFDARKAQFENDSLSFHILKKNYTSKSLKIQSPINGNVYELYVQNGDYVEAGQKLAVISSDAGNYLEVSLPKRYFSKLSQINSGTFKMEYDKKLYSFKSEAKISNANRITPGSPYIPLMFNVNNENLLPGSFTEVWLNVEKSTNAMVLPKSALMEQQGLYFVFEKVSAGDFHKLQVEVEAMNAYEVKISSGLHFGDEIVTEGVLELKLIQSNGAIDPCAGHNH